LQGTKLGLAWFKEQIYKKIKIMTKKKDKKLSTLLAITDSGADTLRKAFRDYISFFSKSQGAFTGERKTYEPLDNTVDEPNRRGNRLVQTTVSEKMDWLLETNGEYIDALFTKEKTNASGKAKAVLVVEGEEWGEFTSLELLALKSFLDSSELKSMMEKIPVRSDSKEWTETDAEMYADREGLYETKKTEFPNRTTEKENYILPDPNLASLEGSNYVPQIGVKNITKELGMATYQEFSGEWSQRQRATALRKRDMLLKSVLTALKEANDVAVAESKMKGETIFEYLFK